MASLPRRRPRGAHRIRSEQRRPPDQWEHFKPGSDEPYKVESDTDGDGNVDSVWETSDQ